MYMRSNSKWMERHNESKAYPGNTVCEVRIHPASDIGLSQGNIRTKYTHIHKIRIKLKEKE